MTLKVFSGTTHPALAAAICDNLGIKLGNIDIFKFSNDCTFVQIGESVRNDDVFCYTAFALPGERWHNGVTDNCRCPAQGFRKNALRQFCHIIHMRNLIKDQPRIPITARLVANLLETAGVDRVLTMDLHSTADHGIFTVPVDHLTSLPILSAYLMKEKSDDMVVVAPDAGRAKLARVYGRLIGAPIALLDKQRIGNEERVVVNHLVGDVAGKQVLLVEDEIASGGTMIAEADFLSQAGATNIYVACTHGVFSGRAVERIVNSPISRVAVTDTLPISTKNRVDKIVVLVASIC